MAITFSLGRSSKGLISPWVHMFSLWMIWYELDVDLGVSWFRTLGKAMIELSDLSMKLWHNEKVTNLSSKDVRQGKFCSLSTINS